jgi:peptidoglycan hydrolase CwlO-like protein
MSRWNDNATGLQAKITQLTKVHDAESRKLKELEAEYAKLTDEQKKNSKQGQQLATAINEQSAKVKELEKNIDYYTDSLQELTDAGVETREELEKVNKELDEQKQAAKDLGGGIAQGAALGIAGIGAACVGAFAGLNSLVEETKELRTQLGMLETSFTEAGHSVETGEKTFNDLYAVLGDSGAATEASLHLAQFAKSEKELEELTNSLTGAYSKFGASLPIENIAEGASTTLTLNQANAGMVDAIEFAGGSVEDFNKKLQALDTEEEKRAFILQTLNESYGEAGEKYKEVNKEVIAANDAQNKYNQAMAEIAEKAQPAITSFKTAMVGVLQTVMEKFSEVDIEGLIGKISGAITTLVNVALPPLMTGLTWVLDNANWLVPVLGTLVVTIGAITAGIKAYNAVMKIAKVVQLAWNLAMSANPIGLVITAIGLLVAAFVTLWKKCEGFRDFWKGFINILIGGVNALIKGLNKISIDIPDWVPEYGGGKLGFNIPLIPKLAEGGVVDKATLAMIGENGKEVVMPLEKNTAWIDKLADKLSAKSGSKTTNNTVNNYFEKMETSRHALHKANLETKRILTGV